MHLVENHTTGNLRLGLVDNDDFTTLASEMELDRFVLEFHEHELALLVAISRPHGSLLGR